MKWIIFKVGNIGKFVQMRSSKTQNERARIAHGSRLPLIAVVLREREQWSFNLSRKKNNIAENCGKDRKYNKMIH